MSIQAASSFQKKPLSVKRALLSVFDKTGLAELGSFLHKHGVELVSTGGTAKELRNAGLPVTAVDELTGFPESFDGRVKTLHPAIHGPLLARKNVASDQESLELHGYKDIDLVVVNLYPFEQTVKKNATLENCIENIDIGGPAMLRAAAKNVDDVCPLSSPEQYDSFIEEFSKEQTISYTFRLQAALKTFYRTSSYDTAVSNYLGNELKSGFPDVISMQLPKSSSLRYGENPHQAAAVYGNQNDIVDILHGKQLSYNNLLDVDAALNIMTDYRNDLPTCAIVKHTLPCGVATRGTLNEAWDAAYETDTISPFGGIVAVNRTLDYDTAVKIDSIFTEIIIAPDFEPEALNLLKEKANRRLVKVLNPDLVQPRYTYRTIFGGMLCQQPDTVPPEPKTFRVVTKKHPEEAEMADMLFAWKVVKRVNSNAIVFAKNLQTLGIGCGQPSRLDSSEFAVHKALKFNHDLNGSVVSSDAFFPFRDGVDAAAEAGATAIIQPGGSIRDEEVIQAANEHGICMILTGRRHFKH